MTIPMMPTAPSSAASVGADHRVLRPTVAIIGAGPAGLRAAAELAPRVEGEVLVLERESVAGGIPRHSDHSGYGIRDLGKCVSGPRYAEILRDRATRAGARIMTNAMATDWAGPTALDVTSPEGRLRVDAQVVVLATGARERPRSARLIPGDRATGVYTTGQLQNIVHLKHGRVGDRAVVVGSELVSWSAVLTLRHAGCATALMTTQYPRSDSYLLFNFPGRILFRVRVATRTRVTRILGRDRVTGVEIEHVGTGRREIVTCDTVVLTGDWIPDNELARAAGVRLDSTSKAPLVDTALRTDKPGVFAIGNLLHPVDTADIAALDGATVARHVLDYLAQRGGVTGSGVASRQDPGRDTAHDGRGAAIRLHAVAPLRWIAPGILRAGVPTPPRRRLLAWSDEFIAWPEVVVEQQGRVVARRRLPWPAAPGRVFRIPATIVHGIDLDGGDVTIRLRRRVPFARARNQPVSSRTGAALCSCSPPSEDSSAPDQCPLATESSKRAAD